MDRSAACDGETFQYFGQLPDLVKRGVIGCLPLQDVAAMACCSRDLSELAREFATRTYACAGCRNHLFRPQQVDGSVNDFVPVDGAALCVDVDGCRTSGNDGGVGAGIRFGDAHPSSDMGLVRSLCLAFGVPAGLRVNLIVVSGSCGRCGLYVGCKVMDVDLRSRPGGARGGSDRALDEAVYLVKERLLGMMLVPRRYVVPLDIHDQLDTAMETAAFGVGANRAYRCHTVLGCAPACHSSNAESPGAAAAAAVGGGSSSGAGSGVARAGDGSGSNSAGAGPSTGTSSAFAGAASGGGGSSSGGAGHPLRPASLHCNTVLFQARDILSKEHCWDVGTGRQGAFYVNALQPGSYRAGEPYLMGLAQGKMQVADVYCSGCSAQIGWKFCQDLTHSKLNSNQVGRFGVVQAAFTPTAMATVHPRGNRFAFLEDLFQVAEGQAAAFDLGGGDGPDGSDDDDAGDGEEEFDVDPDLVLDFAEHEGVGGVEQWAANEAEWLDSAE